jgi:flagellar biosynthesis/type III secretory pathway chaperone
MPLRPEPVLSRLGLRLRERRHSGGAGSSLTDEDRKNVESFEQVLTQTLALMAAENDALVAGDIAAVAGLYDEKARLLKTLELHQPRIEPFLREGGEPVAALRGLIRDLADQIQVNGRLLKGMAEASRSILGEIERTRSRQSLRGLYDKSGQLRSTAAPESGNLRKTL